MPYSKSSPAAFMDSALCSSILLSYRSRALRSIAHYGVPLQDQDDVFQEAALLFYSKGGAALDPVGYFLGIVKWVCLIYHRRLKSGERRLLTYCDPHFLAEVPTPATICHSAGPSRVVLSDLGKRAVRLGHPVERDSLRMAAEGYTPREIGAVLGVHETHVRKRLRAAREVIGSAR